MPKKKKTVPTEDALFQVLIPTMPQRKTMLANLLAVLESQFAKWPQATFSLDDGAGSIGVKRQRMLDNSKAKYVAFVDDDDMVAPDYLDRIMPCLTSGPDVVGITMHVTMDGQPWHPSPIFRHSLRFKENKTWQGNDRTPHHLCPMRRDIAVRSRFPDLMWGEDYNFALGVLPHLHTEEWSGDEPLYFYEYRSRKPFDSEA
jgi:glycosyltransferase involved in cell wall biosynthesis